jgi:hypothetical protein
MIMQFRTLALALALSSGVTGMVQAAPKKTHAVKAPKTKKGKRYKQSNASKVKPRKAKKTKRASR